MDLVVVNNREVDGRILTFAASGWTYENIFVLWDHETGSLWYPDVFSGATNRLLCIGGEHRGRRLPPFPAEIVRWNVWVDSHSDTRILR